MSTVSPTHTAALARLGHALSDTTRTGILLRLREAPARPSELAGRLAVSKQVVSNHLACLRGCGLVTSTTQGRSTWYALADPHVGAALVDLLDLVATVDPGCCTPQGCTCR